MRAAMLSLVVLAGCHEQGWVSLGPSTDAGPTRESFKTANVSLYLERTCGSLDCHGAAERPLRIFGPNGLRVFIDPKLGIDAGFDAGAGFTPLWTTRTAYEEDRNYESVVGLEPEVMHDILRDSVGAAVGADVSLHRLLLIGKPLACGMKSAGCDDGPGIEHKGGPVFAVGSDGYRCLTRWLRGDPEPEACFRAAGSPNDVIRNR